jgi:formate--tetrahydrofolate ligase
MHLPIYDTARKLGLAPEDIHPYGREMAKVDLSVRDQPRRRENPPRLILVSAITPTPAGEGKTTTSIGLAQGLSRLGESVCLALREPSLGPCFGMKGGGTGGGRSRLEPSNRINLHFTGDLHAITSAHNLLAAMLDNSIYFDNELRIDARRVLFKRVMDMNDRALRDVVIGLGGKLEGVPRESGFDITAASEVMAILCLAEGPDDLRARLDRILLAFTYKGEPVTANSLNATGAMLAILRDAIMPNLVRTTEGVPALVHGGPFANIAHGCNSVIATKTALHLADWVITEAGFGFALGAEKFFDIKARGAGLDTSAVVLVATCRALRMHGGASKDDLGEPDPAAVEAGLENLEKHIESIQHFGERPIVALNRFGADTEEEIEAVRAACERLGVAFAVSDHFASGGEGAIDLAHVVMEQSEISSEPFTPLYPLSASVPEKVKAVAEKMYGATDVYFTKRAANNLKEVERLHYQDLPICVAKTHSSLSDNPKLKGRPRDFMITVERIEINAGAGFLVVLTGDIIRMPGLPRRPRAEEIDLIDGELRGIE